MYVGIEFEFFLFECGFNGVVIIVIYDCVGYFDFVLIDWGECICCEIVSCLVEMGFEIEVLYYEVVLG